MKITFAKPALPKSGALAVLTSSATRLSGAAADVDSASGGALSRAVKANRFRAEKGEILELIDPQGLDADRVLLVGTGKTTGMAASDLEAVGAAITARLLTSGVKEVGVSVDDGIGSLSAEDAAIALATGLRLRSYRFDKYRTKEPAHKKPSLRKATMLVAGHTAASKRFKSVDAVIDGVFLSRDLISEPANILHPESFAKEVEKLSDTGLEIEILGEKEMKKLGMHSLLSVGHGSARDSKLAIMKWNGGKKGDKPLAFIGKGVCFDTGGISLKPADKMWDMKWDMGGAGIVTGLMKALAGRKAQVNAIGVLGLVENMPSHKATRPGDVVTSMSGQTIEILNTDAEGRLVLADAITYTKKNFDPALMVDLATLTGAIIVALGHEYAGLFSNNDTIAGRIAKAGEATGDKVWRLPLGDAYDRDLNTPTADMKNIGGGRDAGSIIAAQFLQRFVEKTPWAHIDVAGMVWSDKDGATWEKGATGFGVRLLDRFVADTYEG